MDYTQAAVEALLAKYGGRISPKIVLDEARDPSSPFHHHFEWDDDAAAEQFRLAQAASLIRTWKGSLMRIDVETKIVHVTPTRRTQSPAGQRSKGGASYETIESIMADPDKRADMLDTVLKELSAYRKRYAELHELAAVWDAIDVALLERDDEKLGAAAGDAPAVATPSAAMKPRKGRSKEMPAT